MGLMGSVFLMPIFLQNLLGFTAMQSGVAMMPRAIATGVFNPIVGKLYNRVGPRLMVGVGLVLSALSFWQLAHLTTATGAWDIFWPQVWGGLAFSVLFVALSTAALSTIDKPRMTQATGLYNVVRQVCGSVGIALAATELTRSSVRYHDLLAEHVTVFDAATTAFLARVQAGMVSAGADVGTAAQRALAVLNLQVHRQAVVLAYNHIFSLCAVMFLLAMPLVWMLASGRMRGVPESARAGAGERGYTPAPVPPEPEAVPAFVAPDGAAADTGEDTEPSSELVGAGALAGEAPREALTSTGLVPGGAAVVPEAGAVISSTSLPSAAEPTP
jgi:DHA2 family multidrug resistance protein